MIESGIGRKNMMVIKSFPRTRFLSAFIPLLMLSVALAQAPSNLPESSVKVHVLVTDKSKHPVTDLNQDDFLIFEGGKPQAISSFQKEEIPISYGLIIDNTGSMRPSLNKVRQVATAIVNNNRLQDQTFIARLIDGKVFIPSDWTSEKALLLNSLSFMNDAVGIMSIIDATYSCSEYIAKHLGSKDTASRRRAIILITDGFEKNSSKKMDELIKQLHKDNVQVFTIGIISTNDMPAGVFGKSLKERATDFLDRLAEETGGRSFYPKSEGDLGNVAGLITSYMRSQYVIGYTATGTASKDGYRKVSVKLVDKPNLEKFTATTRLRYLVSGKP
jgi:Ca-activated chloride channel family protein